MAVQGLPFSPQTKFMYQIYLFSTPLHCHPAKLVNKNIKKNINE
jgi:hypothetical protein